MKIKLRLHKILLLTTLSIIVSLSNASSSVALDTGDNLALTNGTSLRLNLSKTQLTTTNASLPFSGVVSVNKLAESSLQISLQLRPKSVNNAQQVLPQLLLISNSKNGSSQNCIFDSNNSKYWLWINPIGATAGDYSIWLTVFTPDGKKVEERSIAVLKVKSVPNKHFVAAESQPTTTPIKHLVVIFQENIPFDKYFGTYPYATNQDGITDQVWKIGNQLPNNYLASYDGKNTPQFKDVYINNPNTYRPYRLPYNQDVCTDSHEYYHELFSVNNGAMDQFASKGGSGEKHSTNYLGEKVDCRGIGYATFWQTGKTDPKAAQVMGYRDGNSVTALWNYANNFALNDNSYQLTYGQSSTGHVALAFGATGPLDSLGEVSSQHVLNGYMINDAAPAFDLCSATRDPKHPWLVAFNQANIGELLSNAKISWGWFAGGFDHYQESNLVANCEAHHAPNHPTIINNQDPSIRDAWVDDYDPENNPFQYAAATANPAHLAPTVPSMIGGNDVANHNYGFNSFVAALNNESGAMLPAVTYLKPRFFQSAHGTDSDAADEQDWLVTVINAIQNSSSWHDTAIVIMYDDSDGKYDHVIPPLADSWIKDNKNPAHIGYGPRLPLLVISPYAKTNYIDNTLTDQTSVIKFIRYNWQIKANLGASSNDRDSGSLLNMFDFAKTNGREKLPLFLDKDGRVCQNQQRYLDRNNCPQPLYNALLN